MTKKKKKMIENHIDKQELIIKKCLICSKWMSLGEIKKPNSNVFIPRERTTLDKTHLSCLFEDLKANTDYYIRLAAVNKEGHSEWTERAVKTPTDTGS